MDHQEAWDVLRELLQDQRFAVLATQGGGHPYTSLVAFAALPDLRQLIFPTRRGTRKYANLASSPPVSLLIDSRANAVTDYRDAVAVNAIGLAQGGGGGQDAEYRARLLDRHPSLAGFLADADCRIATVRVTEYRLVTNFEVVTVLDPAVLNARKG